MCTVPIGLENLGLRDEVWRQVLKSLDSSCSGLGLVMTGDAALLAGGQHPIYFGILVFEQVVNVWGRSLRNVGTGNDLLYPQGLRTRISDVRISVLKGCGYQLACRQSID